MTKNHVFVLNKVKNGPKRPYNTPNGLKMYERRQKVEFLDLKNCFLGKFSLAELGGTPLPPLTENHPAQKPLAEVGGTPPHLAEKIHQVVFDGLPKMSFE